MDLVRSPDLGLAPIETIDSVQAGEQVDAFWTVFILDKMWVVALGAASSITDQITGGTPISTPWPLSMEAYEKVRSVYFVLICHLTLVVYSPRAKGQHSTMVHPHFKAFYP